MNAVRSLIFSRTEIRRQTPLAVALLFSLPLLSLLAAAAIAAKPTVAQALKLTPIQADVDFDQPPAAEIAQSTLKAETIRGSTGWVVRDGSGQTLRQFVDSNSDNKVDLWCYFQNGIEVYRDIDANFNGKADQYRWLGTAGIRWGLDADEDGTIDRWKVISPEEVSSEVVAALRTRDAGRFGRLLLTSDELKQLRLGTTQAAELAKKVTAARAGFAGLAGRQQVVTAKSAWIHFAGGRPGVLPAGNDGSQTDLYVYDNVAAFIETGGKHSQVAIGTLVKVGEGWRAIGLPSNLDPGQANNSPTGYFFNASLVRNDAGQGGEALAANMQTLVGDLEKVDRQLTAAAPDKRATLNGRRADLLLKLSQLAQGRDDRVTWLRQFADTVSAAAQAGEFPGGVQRLKQVLDGLKKDPADRDMASYFGFRYLTADYTLRLQDPKANFAAVQKDWLERLNQFVKDYPRSSDAPEAMLQLAIAHEFAGEEKDALQWYAKILSDFPDNENALKARGGKRRLESVGKTIPLRGPGLDGRQVDVASFRGRVVVVHYWATWCEPCKKDIELLGKLQTKFSKRKLAVIGVNLDSKKDDAKRFVAAQRIGWSQLYEPGGLDGRLANEMGILTLPTMLLLDSDGKVVNRNIHSAELEAEIRKIVR